MVLLIVFIAFFEREKKMGRTPCCDNKMGLKKGPWTSEEDEVLVNFIKKNGGHGSWRSLPKITGFISSFICLSFLLVFDLLSAF